jgi:hypothetical protein
MKPKLTVFTEMGMDMEEMEGQSPSILITASYEP